MKYVTFFLVLLLVGCSSSKPPAPVVPDSGPVPPPTQEENGQAFLYWVAPVEYTDKTRINSISAFKVYVSTNKQEILNKEIPGVSIGGQETSILIDNLKPTTYYFAVSAVDENGIEGELSEILDKKIDNSQPEQLLECRVVYELGSYAVRCD